MLSQQQLLILLTDSRYMPADRPGLYKAPEGQRRATLRRHNILHSRDYFQPFASFSDIAFDRPN